MAEEKPYFDLSQADRTRKGTFTHVDEVEGFDAAPGVTLKPITGENLMMSFVYMQPHSVAPEHAHPEEQMGTIIEGSYEFIMNGERRLCRKGDVYFVPPNVPHMAVTYDEPCLALDVFNPPRAAFKALMEAAAKTRRGE
jgi:quercetin dioxygenase-like cupin family protein